MCGFCALNGQVASFAELGSLICPGKLTVTSLEVKSGVLEVCSCFLVVSESTARPSGSTYIDHAAGNHLSLAARTDLQS